MQLIPTSKESLIDFLKDLPKEPGIYKFLDEKKIPLYIGKAKNVKNRVPSYFKNSKDRTKKIKNLIKESSYLDISLTKNELEALLLEQYLIKEYKPKFNVQFKDDKGYPWIRIDSSKDFPSAKSFLGKKKDKETYFGPYPSSYAVRNVLNIMQKTFKLRNCTDSFFKNRTRPCMQYEIGRCSAPCVQYINKKDYLKEVWRAIQLLEGKSEDIITEFYSLMDLNSKNKSYERAALYRDKISALREIQRNQSITGYTKERDAICTASLNGITKIGVTHVNKGWITGHENFTQKNASLESSILGTFIKRHYFSSSYCPRVIVSSEQIPQKNTLEMALSKFHDKEIKIITKPGKKDKGLIEITKSNTLLAVKRSAKSNKDISHIFISLKDQLQLKQSIRLIESYDVSHHAGAGAVGGCVVYSSKGKLKDKYRLFNISDLNIQNDIASMQEVIRRRFTNQELDLDKPSHILVDGGRAHLRAVENTLNSMNIKDIEVISISKGARRKAEFDTIHKIDGIFRVSKGSYPDLFIQELRDETHRFAVTNQKKKQTKLSMKSALDNIQGIGTQKKKILLRYFGSLEQVERAGFQDLLNVEGVGKKTAELIYNHLH